MRTKVILVAVACAVLAAVVAACPTKVVGCSQDSDCDAGLTCRTAVCVNLQCTPACDAGFTCLNQLCVSPNCATGPCAAGLLCDGTGCASPACINSCPGGEACTSTGVCEPKGCTGRNCPNNYVCINAVCRDRGCEDAGCPAGDVCAAGICYPSTCPDGGVCGAKQACFDGGCADPLCFGVTCATGTICHGGICSPPNCTDGIKDQDETDIDCGGQSCQPCPIGERCKGVNDCVSLVCTMGVCGRCANMAACQTGELCDVDSGYCHGCTMMSDCPPGEICDPNTNLCANCNNNADCDGGGVCVVGLCGPCTATTQCSDGLVCVPPTAPCVPCTSSTQCLGGVVCSAGHCGCTMDSDCGPRQICNTTSGVCLNCYYKDNDGDTYGDPNAKLCQATQPAGYVVDATDCDDNDPKVHPGQTQYFLLARDGGGFDFNCDGMDEKDPQFNCAETLSNCEVCSSTQCAGSPGYDGGVAACGGSGAFCYCAFALSDAGTPDAGGSDGGASDAGPVDAGPPDCSGATGTASCAAGGCPAGYDAYQAKCAMQAIGCH